jgi:hypothetical protein
MLCFMMGAFRGSSVFSAVTAYLTCAMLLALPSTCFLVSCSIAYLLVLWCCCFMMGALRVLCCFHSMCSFVCVDIFFNQLAIVLCFVAYLSCAIVITLLFTFLYFFQLTCGSFIHACQLAVVILYALLLLLLLLFRVSRVRVIYIVMLLTFQYYSIVYLLVVFQTLLFTFLLFFQSTCCCCCFMICCLLLFR